MNSPEPVAWASTAPQERIEALDVVRGFALLGIFLMNIEYFNRSTSGIGEGMPLGLTGLDWWASWFIAYFVQGKFWTIFSLLFGMGFAVMLTRAQQAERDFIAPYLRRILGLAVFGALHYIFLWSGDILFSYAMAAGALLVLLYGQWRPILLAVLLLVAVGLTPDMEPVFAIAGGLSFVSLLALYVRAERRVKLFGRSFPLFSFILLAVGSIGVLAAVVLWLLPDAPTEPRVPVTIACIILLILGSLSARFHDPAALRQLRLGVTLYTFMALTMTLGGVGQYFQARAAASAATTGPPAAATQPASGAKGVVEAPEKKSAKTEAQEAAEQKVERAERLSRRQEEIRNEVKVLSSGSYLDTVEFHAGKFPKKVAFDAGFSTVLLGMFLLGSWFVRSGVMLNTKEHLPLFRKLALYGLSIGIGLGLLGSLIAVSHVAGDDLDGFQIGRGLATLGNLPACLGYVGLVVLMLHSNSFWSRIRVLAPMGRMALTNYLTQSVICAFYFFGWGLGHWGMGRASQVVFVALVFSLQLAFSHWWLARFRYGPMEWLWRGFTYRQIPPMRL